MMRSLFSGVSGLRVHQTKMDVMANNIANVNTVGYKSSRVTFNEVFTQTLQGASGANASTGKAGTNPMQIGLGSNVASIDKLMTTGATQRTDNPMDLMIAGAGFFIVGDNSGQYFTRAGNFIEDEEGFLSLNGMKLMGWDAEFNEVTKREEIVKTTVKAIQIGGDNDYVNPAQTSTIDLGGNLNTTDAIDGKSIEKNMSVFDTVGNKYTIKMQLTYDATANTGAGGWTLTFPVTTVPNPADPTNPAAALTGIAALPNGDTEKAKIITIAPVAGSGGTVNADGTVSFPMTFNTLGQLTSPVDPKSFSFQMKPTTQFPLEPAAEFGKTTGTPPLGNVLVLDLTDLHQFSTENTNAKAIQRDGYAPGSREGLSVSPDGKVYGQYSNGMTKLLGQIPIATFKNPSGLEKVGSNLFLPTANSGEFDGTGDEGELMGGILEMANVDLAAEFTEMITTQRGFQANSRIITTSDDMLQELVNLKR